jgi:hypothetical protein
VVVIHRAHGFRFVIYTADHEPAHIHITGVGQAKVNLCGPDDRPELVYVIGIKQSDMRRLMSDVVERRDEFMSTSRRNTLHFREGVAAGRAQQMVGLIGLYKSQSQLFVNDQLRPMNAIIASTTVGIVQYVGHIFADTQECRDRRCSLCLRP